MVQYGPVWSCMFPYGPLRQHGPLLSCMVPYIPVWSVWSHMVPFGIVWSRMAPYSLVWSLTVPYGPVWSHMVPYGCLHPCLVLHSPVGSSTVLYGPLWLIMAHFGQVRPRMAQFGSVWFRMALMVPYCWVWPHMFLFSPCRYLLVLLGYICLPLFNSRNFCINFVFKFQKFEIFQGLECLRCWVTYISSDLSLKISKRQKGRRSVPHAELEFKRSGMDRVKLKS